MLSDDAGLQTFGAFFYGGFAVSITIDAAHPTPLARDMLPKGADHA